MNLTAQEIIHNPTIVVINAVHKMSLDFFLDLMTKYNDNLVGFEEPVSLVTGFMDLRGKHLDDLVHSVGIELNEAEESRWTQEQLKHTLDALIKLDNFKKGGSYQSLLGHTVRFAKGSHRTLIIPDDNNYLVRLKTEGKLYIRDSTPDLTGKRRVELEL